MAAWTIARLLVVSADFLASKGSSSARLDAELLLAEVLGLERIRLYTEFDRPLTDEEVDAYRELVARRAHREPVAYILGRAHFRYLTLEVTPDVLIPRPETEELVDAVLAWLRERPLLLPEPAAGPRIADVGTGSGAIAFSLAQEGQVRVLATDASSAALQVAERNRDALGLGDLVDLRETDLLVGVDPGSLRVVVSNPPYVSAFEYQSLDPGVRDFEPPLSLRGGHDGLECYRRLMPQAAAALGPGGAVFVEVGDTQASAVTELARAAGFVLMRTTEDLSGKERIVRAVRPGALRMRADDLDAAGTATLARALAAGAILGVPTDTVYGIAAAWNSPAGVRRLFAAKGRDEERPTAVLFPSVASVRAALPDLDPRTAQVLAALLPGPYTFVVGTAVERPHLVGTYDSLGVRVPDHPLLLALLAALGTPLAASSANPSGGYDAATVDDVDPLLLAHCIAAVDFGGSSGVGAAPGERAAPFLGAPSTVAPSTVAASTVVDLRPLRVGEQAVVLREGVVPSVVVMELIAAVGRGGPICYS